MKNINYVIKKIMEQNKERKNLITELNKLDEETKNKTLLKAIEYFYYSKKLSNSTNFIKNIYYLYENLKTKIN